MNEKEIIKKLIKIADNQQKIINKLAQSIPTGGATDNWVDISQPVAGLLAGLKDEKGTSLGSGVSVTSAQATPNGNNVAVKLRISNLDSETPEALRQAMVGQYFDLGNNRKIKMPDDINNINVIGET